MLFAGFDISSVAIGWSLVDRHGKVVACGTYRPEGIDVWARLAKFAPWLDRFMLKHKPRAVAIEEPLRSDATRTERSEFTDAKGHRVRRERNVSITPMATARALYAFAGVARMICSMHRVECIEVNQRTWRSTILGVAQAPREIEAKKRTKWLKDRAFTFASRVGAKPDSDDAGEGACIGLWLYGEICRRARDQRARIAADKAFRGRAA